MPDASDIGAEADLALLIDAAREAGALARTYFGNEPEVWLKGNASPVSEADMAVDALLGSRLRAARPDYGWLSEETTDDRSRLSRDRLFVVDPIDGTKVFLRGGDTWTVSIAVVEHGRPVTGVLYNPVRDELFTATRGGGALLNGRPVEASPRKGLDGSRAAGPRKYLDRSAFSGVFSEEPLFVGSLAYRFALVAAGRVDVAAATPRSHDWDLAAVDLLVHEAGGRLTDLAGDRPVYNRPELKHPVLAAAAPGVFDAFVERLARTLSETAGIESR